MRHDPGVPDHIKEGFDHHGVTLLTPESLQQQDLQTEIDMIGLESELEARKTMHLGQLEDSTQRLQAAQDASEAVRVSEEL